MTWALTICERRWYITAGLFAGYGATLIFQQEGDVIMKILSMLVLVAALFVGSTGCSTPAYSARERDQQIARNWNYEGAQMVDDFDHLLLLRPSSRLTIWNVR